jgi:Caspase domain/Putative peptidoglycan binding domain
MSRVGLSAMVSALALFCATIWADPAFAERRVALVIGNSAYQNAPVLPNPAKDAKAIVAMFVKAGYDVVSAQYDVGNLDFKRAIRQFEDSLSDADIAVVYYAGHGIEIHGTNYLVPVDARLKSDRDADDEAITLDRLTQSLDGAKKLRLIILDACRDNPFGRTMKKEPTAASRGINPGLGAVEPSSTNTLIAYAARAGSEAEDGDGDHSPFALALINNLFLPGLDIRLAFGRVRDEVLKKTANRQEPFVYGSLGAGTVALVAAPAQPVVATDDLQGVKSDYSLVEKIGTRGAWEVFLTQHPTGFYSDLARQQIAKLNPGEATPTIAKGSPQSTLASIETPTPPTPPGPSTEEQRAWDKIKDSSNEGDFRDFIKKYPTSVLANVAQSHIDAIERAAQEQAAKAQATRDAAAEAQRQADAKRKADEAARQNAGQQAALAKAQAEAKAAEQARQQAERDAALKRAEEDRQKQLSDAAALAKAQAATKAAEQARQQAEREAALKRDQEAYQTALAEAARKQEAACKDEQDRLTTLQAAGKTAADDLKQLAQGLTCERLGPLVTAALDKASAPDVNTPDQVRAAQQQLTRLGCFSSDVDGNLNDATKAAVQRYQAARGNAAGDGQISDALVSDLKSQTARICPLVCPTGKIAQGEQCVVAEQPKPVARQKGQDDNSTSAKHTPAKQDEEKPSRKSANQEDVRPARPVPTVKQEATTHTGGNTSGHASGIGVGF